MADVFYNKTVTVFNQSTDDLYGEESWFPSVLENVRLLETKSANITQTGMNEADASKLFIRTDSLAKQYLEPRAWESAEDKTKAFTLAKERDFFVVGDVSNEDTTKADFFSYMKNKYDGVYRITNVDKYDLIPHLEVGGR